MEGQLNGRLVGKGNVTEAFAQVSLLIPDDPDIVDLAAGGEELPEGLFRDGQRQVPDKNRFFRVIFLQ